MIGSELPESLPDGCVPLFLATRTQELFGLRTDEDVQATSPFRLLRKDDVQRDIHNRAAVSDFQPLKKLIEVRFVRESTVSFKILVKNV